MLINDIELSEALRLVEEFTNGPTNENLYDIFNADDYSLNCNDRRAIRAFKYRQSPDSNSEKTIKASITRKAEIKSFTAKELQASVRRGCRSCEVFALLFSQIFLEYTGITEDSTVRTYTISKEFTLCQHLESNGVSSVKRVQLFHPYGKLIFESLLRQN